MKHITQILKTFAAFQLSIYLALAPMLVTASESTHYFDDSSEEITIPHQEYHLDDIKLFPNPCSNYLNLSLDSGFKVDRIAVSDMLGNLVWEQRRFENDLQFRIQIPVFEFKNGIYFVEIESGNQRITRKISKE